MNDFKIFTLPLGAMQTNCYLLRDKNGEGAVIDPGGDAFFGSVGKILTECDKNDIRIKYILLTHAHFDHIYLLEALRKATNAPVAVHCDDAPLLYDPTLSYMAQYAHVSTPCSPVERLLQDGDKITIGNSVVTVVHTPGHTPGSVLYDCRDIPSGESSFTANPTDGTNAIITGDTLFFRSVGRYDLYGGNEIRLIQSLEKIRQIKGNPTLYPGHGQSTQLNDELQNNPYLQ